MRRIIIFICLSVSMATQFGCTPCTTKIVACNGFDEPAFDQWFPYATGSRLVFKNLLTADTFSYTLRSAYPSEPYEATSGGYNSARFCLASKEIRSDNNGSPQGYMDIYGRVITYFNNGPVEKSVSITFKNSYWTTGAVTVNTIEAGEGTTTITQEANVQFADGQTYPLLATLMTDTTANKTNVVYKLFVAKNKGIVGFETYPSRQKWILQ